jgi:hypothetical protein
MDNLYPIGYILPENERHVSLTELETRIDNNINNIKQSSFEIGQDLRTIRDEKLYKDVASTFEDYVEQRFGLSRPRAYQLIEGANVLSNLSTIVDILPTNEAQTRPLISLPPQQHQEVWQKVESAVTDTKIFDTIFFLLSKFKAENIIHKFSLRANVRYY